MMSISIYVNPKDFRYFLEVSTILSTLTIDNNYCFRPNDIEWQETFNSQFVHVAMDLNLYLIWRASNIKNQNK